MTWSYSAIDSHQLKLENGQIKFSWITVNEVDNAAFVVYGRESSDQNFKKIVEYVASKSIVIGSNYDLLIDGHKITEFLLINIDLMIQVAILVDEG